MIVPGSSFIPYKINIEVDAIQYTTYVSNLYPIYYNDSLSSYADFTAASTSRILINEVNSSASLLGGSLKSILKTYTDSVLNLGLNTSASLESGSLNTVVRYGTYNNYSAESLITSASLEGGTLSIVVGYQVYLNYHAENIVTSAQLLGGDLNVV